MWLFVSLQRGDLTVIVGNITDLGASIDDTGDTDLGTGGGTKPQRAELKSRGRDLCVPVNPWGITTNGKDRNNSSFFTAVN